MATTQAANSESKKQQPDAQNETAAVRSAVCDALYAELNKCETRAELYKQALLLLGRHFDTPYAAIQVESRAGSFEDQLAHGSESDGVWKRYCEGLLFKTRYHQLAQARMLESPKAGWQFAAMAVPITEGSEGVVGSIAVVTPCQDKKIAEARLSELRALVGMVGVLAAAKANAAQRRQHQQGQEDSTGASKAAGYSSLHEFAFAIVNNLKGKLGCEQVCLGLVKRGKVKMLCMSGFDNLYPRSPGARQIEQAMEECMDAGEPTCFQGDEKWSEDSATTGHRLHQNWSGSTGNCAVASVPLMKDDECIAVLSIRQTPKGRFEKAQLEKIGQMVSPLAPGVLLLIKANKTLFGHTWDACSKIAKSTISKGAWGRKVLALGVFGLVAWMAFGSRDYIISVPTELVAGEVRHISTPFEGTIESVHFKPGDLVKQGALLIQMDTKDLVAERDRLLSEQQIARLEVDQASAEKDLASAAQANARIKIAASQLAVVKHKLEKAQIRAPADGRILLGDLSPRIGEVMPMGEPLFQFAPDAQWKLKLHIPEYAAPLIEKGQSGEFTTNAQPDDAKAIELEHIHTSAEVVDGKNVFTVEARVDGETPEWVRSGMKGISRVNVGKRPEWFIWFNRPIDSARLLFWRF